MLFKRNIQQRKTTNNEHNLQPSHVENSKHQEGNARSSTHRNVGVRIRQVVQGKKLFSDTFEAKRCIVWRSNRGIQTLSQVSIPKLELIQLEEASKPPFRRFKIKN